MPPVPTVRQVLAQAWPAFWRHRGVVLAVVALVFVPIDFVMLFVPVDESRGLAGLVRYLQVQVLLDATLGVLGTLAVVLATRRPEHEPALSPGEALGGAFSCWAAGTWVTILFWATWAIGLAFLVVPGVLLGVYWAFHLQVVALRDERGPAALALSHRFVLKRWWQFARVLGGCSLVLLAGLVFDMVAALFLTDGGVSEILLALPVRLAMLFYVTCVTRLFVLAGGTELAPEGEAGPNGAEPV